MFNEICVLLVFAACAVRGQTQDFFINKDLNDEVPLPKNLWATVTVDGLCSGKAEDLVSINLNVPDDLYAKSSNASVFIANNAQNILRVDFTRPTSVQVTLYKAPHSVEKKLPSLELSREYSVREIGLSCRFPRSWLPANTTKVSGGVIMSNGTIYNYYGLRNYMISIPDLMVVGEYKKVHCDA